MYTEVWQWIICQFVAQQEAQRAQFVVEKAKQERQQKIVQAEGEAQAATLISFYLLCYHKIVLFYYYNYNYFIIVLTAL